MCLGKWAFCYLDMTLPYFEEKKNEPKDLNALFFQIPDGKKVIGGSAYKGEPTKATITRGEDCPELQNFKAWTKARQGTFHSCLKLFKVHSG